MARYIDAELFADRLLNAWDTADKEKKSEIVAILSDIVTPILVGTPAADVAPRAEVAREIFEELDKRLDYITVVASPNDCFITTFRKTMEKVTAEIEDLKKKYTEREK